jgi:hypothetical protein
MIFGHNDRMARGLGNGHEKATCQYSAPGVAVRLRCDERIIEVSHDVGGPHAYPRSRTLSPRVIDAQAIEKGRGIVLCFSYTKGFPAGTEAPGDAEPLWTRAAWSRPAGRSRPGRATRC